MGQNNSTKKILNNNIEQINKIKYKSIDELIQDILIKLSFYDSENEKIKIVNMIIHNCLNILISSDDLIKFNNYKIISLCDLMNLTMLSNNEITFEYFEKFTKINDEKMTLDIQMNISDFVTKDLIKYNLKESEYFKEQLNKYNSSAEIYNFDNFDIRFVIQTNTQYDNQNIEFNHNALHGTFDKIQNFSKSYDVEYYCKHNMEKLLKKDYYNNIKQILDKKMEHLTIYLKLIEETKLCTNETTDQKKYVTKLKSFNSDDVSYIIAEKRLNILEEELNNLENKINAIFEICFNDFQEFTPSDIKQLDEFLKNANIIHNMMNYTINES